MYKRQLIEDRLAASISAYALSEDNYYRNIFLDRRNGTSQALAGRLKLLFTPNERMEFGLNAAYAYSDNANVRNGTPINGNSIARRYVNDPVANPKQLPLNILIPTKPWTTATDVVPSSILRQKQIDLHMSIDLGWADLTGLASYGKSTNAVSPDDFDITPLPISELDQYYWNKAANQELVLTSKASGPLEWMLGVTGFQGDARQNIDTIGAITGVRTVARDRGRYQGTEGYAAFGEVTYNAVQNLFLTAGIRYSHDYKEASNGPNTNGILVEGNATWTNWAPRFVARYEFGKNSNVYVSYTEGFKTGAFNPTSAAGVQTPAQPEYASAYELGVKTELMRNLRLNLAAFRSNYTCLLYTSPSPRN